MPLSGDRSHRQRHNRAKMSAKNSLLRQDCPLVSLLKGYALLFRHR